MIDKHGLRMHGLKQASGNTKNYGAYSPEYQEIFYDACSGKVWTVYQYSVGRMSWTNYPEGDIIKVTETSVHMTMQEIADAVYSTVWHIQHNLPRLYVVRDREAGNVIDAFDSLSKANAAVAYYEKEDREDGTYTPDFYEVVLEG